MTDTAVTTFYKATHTDGTDFRTGTFNYAAAMSTGEIIRHPAALKIRDQPETYLSVSISPADCTGMTWPCRLFRVEPVGRVMGSEKKPLRASPNKRAVSALRVVEELPAWQALGPNGEAVISLIRRCRTATNKEILSLNAKRWHDAWSAAWNAAWDASCNAAWNTARYTAWDTAWEATRGAAKGNSWDLAWDASRHAGDAARALVIRDLITPKQFNILHDPWRKVMEKR